jgi:outer membrane protein assembly factor BamB
MPAAAVLMTAAAVLTGCEIGHCPSVGDEDPPQWRIQVGSDFDYDVAVDPAGDLLVAGVPLSEAAGVRKWRSDGSLVWDGCADGADASDIVAVAVGADGDVVASYQRYSQGPTQVISGNVVKCSGVDGAEIWSRPYTSGAYLTAFALAVDPAGNVVMGGAVRGTVDFGGGPLGDPTQDLAFLAQLDADGNHRWSRVDPGGTYDAIVIVDDDVVAASNTAGSTAVARFSGSDGSETWRRPVTGANCFQRTPLAAGDGRVFVSGHDDCQAPRGSAIVYALDATSGDEAWQTSLVGPYLTVGGIAANAAGTVAVVAHSPAYLKVPAHDLCLEQQGEGLVYLTRFDALSGAPGPSARIGLPELDGWRGISAAGDGSWIIAGSRFPGPEDPFGIRQALLSAHAP